jgi:hypothetical protein
MVNSGRESANITFAWTDCSCTTVLADGEVWKIGESKSIGRGERLRVSLPVKERQVGIAIPAKAEFRVVYPGLPTEMVLVTRQVKVVKPVEFSPPIFRVDPDSVQPTRYTITVNLLPGEQPSPIKFDQAEGLQFTISKPWQLGASSLSCQAWSSEVELRSDPKKPIDFSSREIRVRIPSVAENHVTRVIYGKTLCTLQPTRGLKYPRELTISTDTECRFSFQLTANDGRKFEITRCEVIGGSGLTATSRFSEDRTDQWIDLRSLRRVEAQSLTAYLQLQTSHPEVQELKIPIRN